MRRVALLGGAEETRAGVAQSKADEIWTLNWSYLYDYVPRIDRLFEMHPVWLYATTDKEEWAKPRKHWDWLRTQPRDYPVYMLRHIPEVINCISYPIDEISAYLFGDLLSRGGQAQDFFSSSFDYMMALAIYEGWDVIELYGFEMGSLTEYRYQREGAAFFIGQAIARGIRVEMPRKSVLLRARRYGYEGGQMIFRQDLELIHGKWQERHRDAMARVQYYEGRMSENATDENADKLRLAREDALISSGGLQLLEYQIRFIDLEEPELELKNGLAIIGV
jgi:hypothetical protein